jgi:hypothetical protein
VIGTLVICTANAIMQNADGLFGELQREQPYYCSDDEMRDEVCLEYAVSDVVSRPSMWRLDVEQFSLISPFWARSSVQ